ncbi:hypothetical protein P154DRAFT_518695 [Amniculicola lignicola CBS 123094]|uniref:Uncharacterized protein n=1 Tax=Amniculicola lignicola CBS 123094 TaxID=1392246 RepID=A0A6A5WTJ2_9PLEO|nr:hypothetical protein P154DRAFT_518695 [Amniculicola lignicola CBS 123094]
MDVRRPLISESSDLSSSADGLETTNNTPVLPSLDFQPLHDVSPPGSPPTFRSRPGYGRLHSDAAPTERTVAQTVRENEAGEGIQEARGRGGRAGLGIATVAPLPPTSTARRVSIQMAPRPPPTGPRSPPIYSASTLSPPNTGDPLMGGFPNDSPANTPDLRRERFSPRNEPMAFDDFRRGVLKNTASRENTAGDADFQRYIQEGDSQRLRPGAPSIRSAYEKDFRPDQECPTTRDFYISRYSWISVSIVLLCLFSTIFSGIFLGLALKGPRYGKTVTTHGSLKPADAILLTSIIAKAIELSFVTSFVAFLGQVLSRRAFMKEHGRGVTLSELSMWRWVVQPGTLITHFETARYAGLSFLGVLSLVSAVLATLYAPAATALVQPTLKFGKWEARILAGPVQTSFANIEYIKTLCSTPIRTDKAEGGSTCLQIEHAGQGYHNYQRYLAYWDTAASNGNGTSDQTQRPPGFGLLFENTTVTAEWINVVNTTELSRKWNRPINNVSLAMPHAGVFKAAHDQRNGILQPEELNSEGIYSLHASVPSPVMNTLCVNMNHDELSPIVYDEWNTHEIVNITTWGSPGIRDNATTTNKTVVDEIFGWHKESADRRDYPPVFARYPLPFNTIMNHTNFAWDRATIYLLGQGGNNDDKNLTGQYVLCQLRMTITPYCSTRYNATGSGGSMEAFCNEDDDMAYIKHNKSAAKDTEVPNWMSIGFDWANSLSLNTGISDGAASNSRLLTQLILQKNEDTGDVELNKALPSPAEALSVMSGCTLLKAAWDAPYVEFWNYSLPQLDVPQTQYFNATVQAQQYGSGGVDSVSKGWIVVLILVFFMNIFVLVYFLFHRGLVTDFSEPPNLFALAVNSPPSHELAGSCGGGPEGKQYTVNWFVNTEGDHLYMEPGAKGGETDQLLPQHGEVHVHPHGHHQGHSGYGESKGGILGTVTSAFDKLRDRGLGFKTSKKQPPPRRPASIVVQESDFEMEDGGTRRQHHYAQLAKRRSML